MPLVKFCQKRYYITIRQRSNPAFVMAQKEKIIYIGEVSWRNQKTKFGIKTDDRRRHMYLVGKTGMGKSNLLENMAIQDIQAGNGIAFIDPHGEAAEKLLDYIPSSRVNDVIYFNPGDVAYPTAFNVMEITNPEHRNLIASGLMAVFQKDMARCVVGADGIYFEQHDSGAFGISEFNFAGDQPDVFRCGFPRQGGGKSYRSDHQSVLGE